jgi:surface polysaccharide O-acyltransferase-like enzyme
MTLQTNRRAMGMGAAPALGAASGRALPPDLLKTLLVGGMISAHVIQLITEDPGPRALAWSDYVNLVTFSGFLLAFGLGVGLSAGRARARSAWERLRPVLFMLLAVYASSFGYLLLVEREALSAGLVRNVLTTRVLYGWSEFLTTFLVLYLVLAVARPALVALGTRPRWLLAAGIVCLASTMVTTRVLWPLVGGVIGHESYPNFPLLPYLPWFLLGIHLGARGQKVDGADLAVGLAATGAFLFAFWRQGWMPERFPPSLLWIIGPGLFLALYLWVAERMAARLPCPGLLLAAGRHVLASLVLSNLAIFGIRHLWGWPVQGGWAILGASLALFAGVTLWGAALDRMGRRRAVA